MCLAEYFDLGVKLGRAEIGRRRVDEIPNVGLVRHCQTNQVLVRCASWWI